MADLHPIGGAIVVGIGRREGKGHGPDNDRLLEVADPYARHLARNERAGADPLGIGADAKAILGAERHRADSCGCQHGFGGIYCAGVAELAEVVVSPEPS